MAEILPTNFIHDQEAVMPGIEPSAPYTIFEPVVKHHEADGSVRLLNAEETLAQMQDFVTACDISPGYVIPLGGGDTHTLKDVVDDGAAAFISEIDSIAPAPEALPAILLNAAELAERSGFAADKAVYRASIMSTATSKNPNLTTHSDGLSGIVKEDTRSAKKIRLVYPIGPGSIIFPRHQGEDIYGDVDYESTTAITALGELSELEKINSPRITEITPEQQLDVDAQQVLPGRILAFDPTRTFWHQAPEVTTNRTALIIDISQTD